MKIENETNGRQQNIESNEMCFPLKKMAVVVFFLLNLEEEEVDDMRKRREVAVVDSGEGEVHSGRNLSIRF